MRPKSSATQLVLERLPSGEFAWLRPSLDAAEPDDAGSTPVRDTYRDLLICAECGCFLSRHDDLCSQSTEPDELIDVDAPIPFRLTARGRAAIQDVVA